MADPWMPHNPEIGYSSSPRNGKGLGYFKFSMKLGLWIFWLLIAIIIVIISALYLLPIILFGWLIFGFEVGLLFAIFRYSFPHTPR